VQSALVSRITCHAPFPGTSPPGPACHAASDKILASVAQDDVPSFSDAQAFQIMEEDLGRPIAAVFSSISEHPIAAASLGQVRIAFFLRHIQLISP
jgi:ABC1 atypical kinase-like domain